jgi:hypothetical protein
VKSLLVLAFVLLAGCAEVQHVEQTALPEMGAALQDAREAYVLSHNVVGVLCTNPSTALALTCAEALRGDVLAKSALNRLIAVYTEVNEAAKETQK